MPNSNKTNKINKTNKSLYLGMSHTRLMTFDPPFRLGQVGPMLSVFDTHSVIIYDDNGLRFDCLCQHEDESMDEFDKRANRYVNELNAAWGKDETL